MQPDFMLVLSALLVLYRCNLGTFLEATALLTRWTAKTALTPDLFPLEPFSEVTDRIQNHAAHLSSLGAFA
jgi:hypothetical protein